MRQHSRRVAGGQPRAAETARLEKACRRPVWAGDAGVCWSPWLVWGAGSEAEQPCARNRRGREEVAVIIQDLVAGLSKARLLQAHATQMAIAVGGPFACTAAAWGTTTPASREQGARQAPGC